MGTDLGYPSDPRRRGEQRPPHQRSVPLEQGSAAPWMLGICALLLLLCGWLAQLSSAQQAAQRAQTASDLAALAAADAARGRNQNEPCQAAAEAAAANRTELSSCRIEGEFAVVTCTARSWRLSASRTSRAGPPRSALPPQQAQPPSPSGSR